jgi:hypothetical protein
VRLPRKRKPGRPKGSGVDLSPHLGQMAQAICLREVSGERQAAQSSFKHFRLRVSERNLTRAYAERRRDLEVRAMRSAAQWNTRFWLHDGTPCGPDQWEALLRHVESLAAKRPRLRELAGELYPDAWRHLRHLPFPLHRLYPAELIDLLQEAGLEPPQALMSQNP